MFETHKDPMIASLNLQVHLSISEEWLKKWKITVNESKSSNIRFTFRKGYCPAVNISQTIIPPKEAVEYLGLQIDCRLNWKEHNSTTRKQLDLKTKRSTGL
jgi:hypothetical protein